MEKYNLIYNILKFSYFCNFCQVCCLWVNQGGRKVTYFHNLEYACQTDQFEISLWDKISLRCEVTSLADFGGVKLTSVKLTKVKFQTAASSPCKQ